MSDAVATTQATKYRGLVRARTKAMSVFQKAYDKLSVAANKVQTCQTECADNVAAAERAIAEEEANAKFLEAELASIQVTQGKIKDLLG